MRPGDAAATSLGRLERTQAICDRFESDWRAGGRPLIEDHLVDAAGPERAALVRELLSVELHWRRRAGERPAADEYFERLPDQTDAVIAAFGPAAEPTRLQPAMTRPPDPAPGLLLGLLAFQNQFVDRPALLAALDAWVADKARPLGRILLERGALDAATHGLLEALAKKHLEVHGGDPEKSLAALSSIGPLREDLARIADVEVQASLMHLTATTVHGESADRTVTLGESTSGGGRFRALRPHARGGLGRVSVALDRELDRPVALKELQDRHADEPESRARFVQEAEITGKLEHPGIIPVYGLGHDATGRPFYAMRFIHGDSLKEAIAAFHGDEALRKDPVRRSARLRELLRRFTDVCNAVAYAHSRGVLHRDVKPSNILLGPYGETLVVDWGLAKPMGRVASSASGHADDDGPARPDGPIRLSLLSGSRDETAAGRVVGTPAYASPEQVSGRLELLGPASDVYGLGATLYALLTGRAPVESGELGDVLRRVERGEIPPPRSLDPAIPRPLEAVCLKAMALRPGDRYASPRALSEDIERWMADEPVSAWREPVSRRLRRWADRHRTAVTAAAVALVAGVVGLSAVLGVQRRANAGLRAAIGEKDAANAALAEASGRVEARFELAREAIRSFKAGVEEEEALKEDRLRPLRDKLLGSARRFYDRLGALLEGQPDSGSKGVLAESYMELGDLIEQIGQKPEAREAYKKAVAIRRELAARPGSGGAERVEVARALNALGGEALQLGDHTGALAAHEEAIALAEPLAAGPGATVEARRALGMALHRAGEVLEATGADGRALAAYRRARAVCEALAREAAAVPDDRLLLADAFGSIGILLERAGDLSGVLAEFRKAQEVRRALVAEHPAVPDYRHGLAASHTRVGLLLEKTGDPAGALAEQWACQGLMRALVAEHPAVPQYRRDLAISHNFFGRLLEKTGDPAGALAEQRAYQGLMRALAAEHPAVPDFRHGLAASHTRVGLLLEKTGDPAGALAEQRAFQGLMRALVAEHPAVPQYRRDLAVSHNRVGGLLLTLAGGPAEALGEHEHARSLLEALSRAAPNVPDYRSVLAGALNGAADALRDLGRIGEARDRLDRAVALAEALASAPPKATAYRDGLAEALRRRARLELDAGDDAGADGDARRAVALLEGLPSRDGAQWFGLACARATLAAAAGRAGPGPSAGEAPGLADRAIDDLHRAVAMGYGNPAQYRYEPALAPLRGRDDFRLLLLDLAFPADPFAR